MTSEFDKEYLPIWCEDCDQQGYIFIDDLDGSYFVSCKTCGWETSQVSCSKCQMGGEFVRDIDKRPSSWTCPECKTKYELSVVFYETPIMLFTEEILPQPVLESIQRKSEAHQIVTQKIHPYNIFVLFVYLTILVLPMILFYFTPLKGTFWGFLTIFVFFLPWILFVEKLGKKYLSKFYKQ